MTYELWDFKADKARGVYTSLSEAAFALRDAFEREGEATLQGLDLVEVHPNGSRRLLTRDEYIRESVRSRHNVVPGTHLQLHEGTWSLIHYLSAVEGRAKDDLIEEALREYAANHQDRIASYFEDIAQAAGLPYPKKITGDGRKAAGVAVGLRKQHSDG